MNYELKGAESHDLNPDIINDSIKIETALYALIVLGVERGMNDN